MIEVHMKTLKPNKPLDICFYHIGFFISSFCLTTRNSGKSQDYICPYLGTYFVFKQWGQSLYLGI